MRVVEWLYNFKPEDAAPITVQDLSDQPSICPVAPNSVLPVLAGSHPVGMSRDCEQR
ncbi:MAG: hypothetical protein WB952_07595 [Terriglobales bacterium]